MQRFENRKDIMLITHLRHNARENLTRISRLTSIPVSTIFDKLKDYEKTLIKKHTTIVDFKKLGFDIRMNVMLKLAKDTKDAFKDFVIKNENVNSVFRINNGFDFMIEAIFKDMASMEHFMENLEKFNILNKQELFILEDLKREEFLSDRFHTELLLSGGI
jgi:DNA-binding Lrp family transcriptional regulator